MVGSRSLREPETVGSYHVLRTVDESGRHAVFLAEVPNSRRRVALRLDREGRPREAVLDSFLRERDAVEALAHPGAVGVLEVDEDPVLGPFLAAEFVDGLSLGESLRRGSLTPETALAVLSDVAHVIDAAHAAGIVHGDVRPSRILVGRDGAAKLFGFAETDGEAPIGVGTGWPYLAPERFAGVPPSAESDRWSFAAIALELVTGELPAEDGKLPEDLAAPAREVFERALSRDPAERHPSLRSFLEDLIGASALDEADRAALMASLPPVPSPEPTPTQIAARQRRLVAIAALGLAAALGFRAGGDWLLEQVPKPPELRRLQVTSSPAGATVLLDGIPVGETPRTVYAPAHASRIYVTKEGYRAVDRVLGETGQPLVVALEPARPTQVAGRHGRVPQPSATGADGSAIAPPAPPAEPSAGEASGLIPFLGKWLRDER